MTISFRVRDMTQYAILPLLAAGLLSGGLALAQERADSGRSMEEGSVQAQTIPKKELGSADVRKIQSALNEAGYNAGAADGIWGEATARALTDFQKGKGLDVTGELDQETILALGFARDEFAHVAPEVMLKPADVRQVQEALNKEGYRVASVDGVWGPNTESALRDFQQAKGLEPTGKLNHDSILALGLSVSEFAAGEFSREPDSVNR